MAGRRLTVEIIGDSSSLERAYKRSTTASKRFEAQVTGIGRGLSSMTAGFVGVAGATAGLAVAFRRGFEEMREARKVAAQTAAVIESTGGIAGVTAAHVDQLGDSLLKLSGVDDELVKSSANLLLTFTNIRNVVGDGNNIFDQAATAALNLSTALGTDLQTATLQVGKALQDPVRGMTALRRAGVNFSTAQQTTIRRLVESGRLMDAQKLLLRELTTEFGGSAAAAGRADAGLNRLNETINNFLGMVTEKFLPNIQEATTALQKWFDDPGNVQKVSDEVSGFAKAVAGVTSALVEANDKGNKFMDRLHEGFVGAGLRLRAVTLAGVAPFSDWAKREREDTLTELRKLTGEATTVAHTFADALQESLQLKAAQRPKPAAGARPPGTAPVAVKKAAERAGVTATQRNQWFDTSIARQLDRLEDTGLRKQLARLRQIAAEVRARLAVTKDATRRLTLEDTLLGILRQQRSVQADIAGHIKDANQALKDRADAIKSAVIDRLQARQTDILNKRALADAKEQLRIARQIGGRKGVQAAQRGLQDTQFDMLRARLERAPATLTSAGRFGLAGTTVTINVHGTDSPEAVARKVTEILQRRSRRTTTQVRGPAAGSYAGAH